jgi:hypothetical protein
MSLKRSDPQMKCSFGELLDYVCFQTGYLNSDRFEFNQLILYLIFSFSPLLSLFKRIFKFFLIFNKKTNKDHWTFGQNTIL